MKAGTNEYFRLHQWVRRYKGRASLCEECGTKDGRIDWANISKEYKKDLDDFKALCRKCHAEFDKKPLATVCKNGHTFTNSNTHWRIHSRTKTKFRICKACQKNYSRNYMRNYLPVYRANKRKVVA